MNRFLLCYSKSHVIVRNFVNRNMVEMLSYRLYYNSGDPDYITFGHHHRQFRYTEIVCPLLFGEKEMIFLLTRYSIVLQKLLMNPRRKVNDGILQCNVLAGIVALIISDVNSAE